MKIFLISNMYPSKKNPLYGVFVKNFENLLLAEGCEFPYKALIVGRDDNLINRVMNYLSFFKKVSTYIGKNDYDLIYVHFIGHSLIPFLFVRRFINKPLVINAHGSDVLPNSRIGKLIQKLVTPVIQKADLIVVPSEYFKNIVTKKFRIDENNIFVSPSAGIDTGLFKPSAETKSRERFTVGYVSRIDEGKGWDILLDAIRLLKEKDFDRLEVIMIGGGAQDQKLSETVKQYQLQDRVRIIGMVPHSELGDWYRQMDVFVFPTQLMESLGLVGLEAMACGVPVIGSDIGGLRSYIKDGINGKRFLPGNAEALAMALAEFILIPDSEKRVYRMQAFQTALQYDSNCVTERLTKKLLDVLNTKEINDFKETR